MIRDLEYRVAKLERALKNEFLFSRTPKNSDAVKFVNSLFKAQPNLSQMLYVVEGDLAKLSNARKNGRFRVTLAIDPSKVKDADKYNNLSFTITVPEGKTKKDMHCTVFDDYDSNIASYNKFDLDSDVNKVAKFISDQITFAKQKYKIESINTAFENVQLNMFDCEAIVDLLMNKLSNIDGCEVDYTDDNADYGYLSIGIYINNKYVTEYSIIAEDFNSFIVSDSDDKVLKQAKSFKEIANIISDNFKNNYM